MPPKPLKILCFGDSLTEGYTLHGTSYAPYSNTLEKVLYEKLSGEEWDISVEEQGVSGDLVMFMGGRMGEICKYTCLPYFLIRNRD
jgi:lysophospholipase L1-like esterase